jgi:hypothetical protein
MTLKQNEITAIRSGSHLLPDSRARCDLRLGKHDYHNHKDGMAL